MTVPREVRDLALRLGAVNDGALSRVTLTQSGAMKPGRWWMDFTARQTIDVRRPDFEWRASFGPFGCIGVTDALTDGEARLEVRMFHRIRLAGLQGGAPAAKGEIMRYLAELAWAPDAILGNPSLDWVVADRQTFRVAAGRNAARGEVEFKLDAEGRIASVTAADRPRLQGGVIDECPWRGRFFDYRQHHGRWLPFSGEVGWVVNGRNNLYWRGTLATWHAQ